MIEQQDPRRAVEAKLAIKARTDLAFREELMRNPRGVTERELGITIPEGVNILVHEESPTTLHVVLPAPDLGFAVKSCAGTYWNVDSK